MRCGLLQSMTTGVCQPLCHAEGCAKAAERIDILFVLETLEDQRRSIVFVLDGGLHPHDERRGLDVAFAKLLWPLAYLLRDIYSTR